MPTTYLTGRSTNFSLAPAQQAPLPQLQFPRILASRFSSVRLAWAAVAVSSLLSACGGGGGGDAAGPAAPPPPPARPPVTLSAEEDVAWKSYVLRNVGVRAVTDSDESVSYTAYFGAGRFDFAGLYPKGTGSGTAGQSNIPSAPGTVGLCKDGGNNSAVIDDKNKNGIRDAGDIFTTTSTSCKDGNATENGTFRFNFQAPLKFYAKPNDSVIESEKGVVTEDILFTQTNTNFTLTQSIKGQIDVDISANTRVYRYKNYARVVDGVTVINNLVLTIDRSSDFGPDSPFSLTSMTGSLTIDGVNYQVSSSPNIAWKKISSYLPTTGFITMTAANGDQIVTEFTPTGAGCGIIPSGATTPSLVVKNCSRL